MQNEAIFRMVRLTKSKKTVDLSPNTIRQYSKEGLNLYRLGRAVFFNSQELEEFIKTRGAMRAKVMG